MLLQQIVVGALVAACALYSAWRLAGARMRLRALERLESVPGLRSAAWVARLKAQTLARFSAACGGCSQAGVHAIKPRPR